MRRPLLLLSFLLAAAPLLAQQADLSISASVVGVPQYTERTELAVVVTNAGPSTATNVVVTSTEALDGELDSRCTYISGDMPDGIHTRCTLPSLAAGESATFHPQTGSHASFALVIPLEVRADQEDPNLGNNSTTVTFDYVDEDDATVTITPPAVLDADRIGTARVSFVNRTQFSGEAQLTFYVSQIERLVSYDPRLTCTMTPATVPGSFNIISCRTAPIAPHSTNDYLFELQFERESKIAFSATLVWGIPFHDYEEQTYTRPFRVTSVNDSGPGSLRQALLDVNSVCLSELHACRVEFALQGEPSPGGWYTFRPLTPLPEITADWIVVDGLSQTRLADTNLGGPEILLDGAETRGVSGLTFSGRRAEVLGLAIGNFERHGVYMEFKGQPSSVFVGEYAVARNYIGIDPTGTTAMPNGSRGVMVMSGFVHIHDNVLSGNVRSGIYFWGRSADIRRNRIGLAATTGTPIPNGASGIFMGDHPRGYGTANISGNVIAYNGHYGIALAENAGTVIGINWIAHNALGGIDIKLDGPTVDFPSGGSPGVPATPIIQRAFFDGAATIIEGIGVIGGGHPSIVSRPVSVDLYANAQLDHDGFAEGENHIGTAIVSTDLKFFIRIEADLRGQWITGVALQHSSFFGGEWTELASSEFSRPVKVE